MVAVGARCRQAMRAIRRRLSSSGNGVMLPEPARSPASTCTTGMPRWNAASAAPNAELVSPCTSTAAGIAAFANIIGGRLAGGDLVEPLVEEILEAQHHGGHTLVQA